MKQVVIMPGGFHPFHAGHAALYQSAKAAFPGADVYVAATNDTSKRPFPFQVKEKLAQLAGVPVGRFMQVKSPFGAEEILAPYNPEDTQLIFVKSIKNSKNGPSPEGPFPAEPDPRTGQLPLVTRGARKGLPVSDRLQYYRPGQPMAPMSRHSYLAYLPTVEFGPGITSGSEIRNIWPKFNEQLKTDLVMSLYPKTQNNPKLAANVVQMLDTAIGTEVAENQGWAATYEADGLTAGTGVTGGMHASYQTRYNQPVDEARIHFTDPLTKVNVYYITPKLQAQGQVQNVAHNIPYSTVQPLINRLLQKYPNMNPEYIVWYPQGQDQYGQRLEEASDYIEEDKVDPITSAAINFYQDQVGNVSTEPVKDYKEIARELLGKTKNPGMRKKIMNILVQGNKNPYIQGGVITTVGALLAGGILSSASQAGLSPQQTNILLQAVLNTVIPTMVSRVNGRSWRDTVKYTLASAGIGTGIAAMTETGRKK